MPRGPGKFDDLATLVREQAGADGVIVIVIGSPAGSGFAVQASPEATALLPEVLRFMADEIEQALEGGV
jgi:hypothetical protein